MDIFKININFCLIVGSVVRPLRNSQRDCGNKRLTSRSFRRNPKSTLDGGVSTEFQTKNTYNNFYYTVLERRSVDILSKLQRPHTINVYLVMNSATGGDKHGGRHNFVPFIMQFNSSILGTAFITGKVNLHLDAKNGLISNFRSTSAYFCTE